MTPIETRGPLGSVAYDKGEELPCSAWEQLEEGHYVLVQRDGEPIVSGEVDVVCADASVFWIWIDGGRGRIAVYADEGTCVWLPQGYRLRATEELAGEPPQGEALEQPQA